MDIKITLAPISGRIEGIASKSFAPGAVTCVEAAAAPVITDYLF